MCILKTFRPRSSSESRSAVKRRHQEESISRAICTWSAPGGMLQLVRDTMAEDSPTFSMVGDEDLDLEDRNIKQCSRKVCDGHYTAVVRVLSSSGVASYNDATLADLQSKHPTSSAPSLPDLPVDGLHLVTTSEIVLDRIKSFPRGTSCGRDGLRAQHLLDCLSGVAVAVSDELVDSISAVVDVLVLEHIYRPTFRAKSRHFASICYIPRMISP
ncbi:unnamed protein product [Amaranthus hypochondriacus]